MSKIRILRGQLNPDANNIVKEELIKDDSRFTHGFRIKKFVISWNNLFSATASSRDLFGILSTSFDALTRYVPPTNALTWDWDNKSQIAWASTRTDGDSAIVQTFEVVDPTAIVVRELWLGISIATTVTTDRVNYYIELEEITLDENQAVLAIIREEGQSVQS